MNALKSAVMKKAERRLEPQEAAELESKDWTSWQPKPAPAKALLSQSWQGKTEGLERAFL